MKKQVLFGVALCMGSFSFAQNSMHTNGITPPKLNPAVANKASIYKPNELAGAETVAPSFSSIVNTIRPEPAHTTRAYTTTVIGTTGYQLQTNASVCPRFINSTDGTMSATWTYSAQTASWTDRGTGYNYFNGTSWGAAPTARVENVRTGFPSIGITTGGKEIVVSHEASDLHISTRATKGTGTWSNTAFLGSPDIWARMAVGGANGQTLHVISQTSQTSGPLAYSRSLDGGVTWDKLHTSIPEIDGTQYKGFGGDSYAIDAKGDTIVIVVGGFTVDVVMLKSIDNGETWTKTIVKYFPIPMFDEPTMLSDVDGDGNADTLETNDASVATLIDNNGMAHVWYGRMRMLNDDLTDAAVSYFPGTDGLMYWNENMGASTATTSTPVMIAAAADIDGDGTLNVTEWGTYQVSLTSQPSAGIDASGKLYLSYASIYEGNAENGAPGDGKSYRHTYVMSSIDGGTTWCDAQDVTDPPGPTQQDFIEGVYGAMAKHVDGNVHLIVQRDGAVGHGVSTTTSPDPQSGDADIIYIEVPVTDLNTCVSTGVKENASSLSSFDLYPNPASGTANLAFTVANKGKVSIKIFNVTGQMVAELTSQEYAAGNYNMNVNLEKFNAGIYVINMTSADGISTKKLIVK